MHFVTLLPVISLGGAPHRNFHPYPSPPPPLLSLPNLIPQNQVTFRAFRCRSAYRSLLLRRGRAATIIQSAERRKRAFATATDLREQRASPWEQLWDDDSGRLYFFHKVTRSSDDWRQAIDRGWRIRSDMFSPCLTLWYLRRRCQVLTICGEVHVFNSVVCLVKPFRHEQKNQPRKNPPPKGQ